MRRRIDPLYVVSALIAVATLVAIVVAASAPSTSTGRTGSVSDEGPGGAAALRRYVEAMGARTATLQGDRFDPPSRGVVVILGAYEGITEADAGKLVSFVRAGGTVVLATELGIFERSLLDAYRVRISGIAAPGTHPLAHPALADPPARGLWIDRGVALGLPANADVLATDGRAPIAAAIADGAGIFVVVGSLSPFLASGLAEADNARAVLGLVKAGLRDGVIAFDEYHHGVHPSSDVMVLVQQTWPGRALVFLAVVTFLYLVLTGRRLGPPIPLEVRPARSSLEYIRGFAGLVRRSGRGEIARRRLRADLRSGLAREFGLDPAAPFDRVIGAVAANDRGRAAAARAVDDALARPLREDQLLRTVRQIETLLRRSEMHA